MVMEAQVFVQIDSEILKAVHHLHWLAIDGGGLVMGDEFHIYFQVKSKSCANTHSILCLPARCINSLAV